MTPTRRTRNRILPDAGFSGLVSCSLLAGIRVLAAKRPSDAVAEFQKVISLRTLGPNIAWPLAHVGLARAYAASGNAAVSRKAHEDFFALWKDADPDVPVLVEAKREYAILK